MSSHPDVYFGSAVWVQVQKGHALVVISEPNADGLVLFVRFTSYIQGHEAQEGLTVFNSGEYCELSKPSVIHYADAIAGDASAFQAQIDNGKFEPIADVPPQVLKIIIAEGRVELAPKFIAMLPPDDHPHLL